MSFPFLQSTYPMEVIAAAMESVSAPRFLSQGKFLVFMNLFWISPDHYGEELLNLSGLHANRFPPLFILNYVYAVPHPETTIFEELSQLANSFTTAHWRLVIFCCRRRSMGHLQKSVLNLVLSESQTAQCQWSSGAQGSERKTICKAFKLHLQEQHAYA